MGKTLRYIQIILSVIAVVTAFILDSLTEQCILFALFIFLSLASRNRRRIFSFFFRTSLLLLFTLIVHLFFRFGEPDYWQGFGQVELWIKTLFFTTRNANILLIMSYMLRSGKAIGIRSITAYLEGKQPAKLLQPLTLAMRYTGLISDEFRSLQQVHRIMGIKKPRHFIAQARYYTSLIVPTIISSLERAEHLSIALTSRGYNQEA